MGVPAPGGAKCPLGGVPGFMGRGQCAFGGHGVTLVSTLGVSGEPFGVSRAAAHGPGTIKTNTF